MSVWLKYSSSSMNLPSTGLSSAMRRSMAYQGLVWPGQWAKVSVATWSESIESAIFREKPNRLSGFAASQGTRARTSITLESRPSQRVFALRSDRKTAVVERKVECSLIAEFHQDLRQDGP